MLHLAVFPKIFVVYLQKQLIERFQLLLKFKFKTIIFSLSFHISDVAVYFKNTCAGNLLFITEKQ